MHPSSRNILVSVLVFIAATQAAVLPSPTTSTSTTTTSLSRASATPVVVAGNCDQNTLQYCCPLIAPTPGEGSVEFAEACRQGNLPASYDCFFAFESICCQGSPDANGNTCEIVLPLGDLCSPGAAGSIESPGVLVGARTVTKTVNCTSTAAPSSTSVSNVPALYYST